MNIDKTTKEQLLAEVKGWREWWDKVGFEWYNDGEYPQVLRPPVCHSEPVEIPDIDEIASQQLHGNQFPLSAEYCKECGGPWGGHTRMCGKFPGYMQKPKKPSIRIISGWTGKELTQVPASQQELETKKLGKFGRFFEKIRAYAANEEPRK